MSASLSGRCAVGPDPPHPCVSHTTYYLTADRRSTLCCLGCHVDAHVRTACRDFRHSSASTLFNMLTSSCRLGSSILIRFLACPAKHQLSRAPPDLSRPRDRATPPPHGSPPYSPRNNRCHRQTWRAGSAERCSPGDELLGSLRWQRIK